MTVECADCGKQIGITNVMIFRNYVIEFERIESKPVYLCRTCFFNRYSYYLPLFDGDKEQEAGEK